MKLEDLIKRIDANSLGEFLRAASFPEQYKNNILYYGCYSTFDFPKKAKLFDTAEREQYWYSIENNGFPYYGALVAAKEQAELGRGWKFNIDGYLVECCYYWDGDGTLSFKIYNREDSKPIAEIINTDCKKKYYWEHVDDYRKKRYLK